MEYHERVEGPDPKSGVKITENDKEFHFTLLDEPVYHPVFKYCPMCGIKWDGPIRRDYDNEQMLGPKRLKRKNMVRAVEEVSGWKLAEPSWWWVLQIKTTYPNRSDGGNTLWICESKLSPLRFSAVNVYHELNDRRERCLEQDRGFNGGYYVKHMARIITLSAEKMQELYPIAWSGLNEIDWRETR